jgi:hypothetical protein
LDFLPMINQHRLESKGRPTKGGLDAQALASPCF